jgi:hypothetical protein
MIFSEYHFSTMLQSLKNPFFYLFAGKAVTARADNQQQLDPAAQQQRPPRQQQQQQQRPQQQQPHLPGPGARPGRPAVAPPGKKRTLCVVSYMHPLLWFRIRDLVFFVLRDPGWVFSGSRIPKPYF